MGDARGNYNEVNSWKLDEDEERLGREWLGYGSLAAPYWFIGLEAGGDYDPLFARFWIEALGAAPVFDPRLDARVGPNKWFLPEAGVQPTWGPLIETVLGYTGSSEGVLDYQRRAFGCPPPVGEVAVLELSAFAAHGLASPSPHRFTFLADRVIRIRGALKKCAPAFAVFYGTSHRAAFSEIVGDFDADGFKRMGTTLCVLVAHPNARGARRDWRRLGVNLQQHMGQGSRP